MKRLTTTLLVTAVLVGLTWLWPSSRSATRSVELQGPVMRAHFVNVGKANATLLEFPCGVVLVDAGAQDDEHVDGLVDFITSVFDARPELNSTLEAVYVTHNHLDHNAALRAVASVRLTWIPKGLNLLPVNQSLICTANMNGTMKFFDIMELLRREI